MIFIRIALVAAALALTATIIWAAFNAPFWASFGYITANPWGVVTLVDLYSGFLVASILIWLIEPRKELAASVVIFTLVLGNIITLIWLAWRGIAFFRLRFSGRKA